MIALKRVWIYAVSSAFFLTSAYAEARETHSIVVSATLNSAAPSASSPNAPATFAELDSAASFRIPVAVYTAAAEPQPFLLYLFHAAANSWQVRAYVDGANVQGFEANAPIEVGASLVSFNPDGTLHDEQASLIASIAWNNSAPSFIHVFFTGLRQDDTAFALLGTEQDGCLMACPPVGGLDFDGDAKSDASIYRPESGMWMIRRSRFDDVLVRQWGLPGDYPMPGDYTGNGLTDIMVWRPQNGSWYLCPSDANFSCAEESSVTQFGLPGDRPVQGDFDGDGKSDLAVWRQSFGLLYYLSSKTGDTITTQWGLPTDIPLGALPNQ